MTDSFRLDKPLWKSLAGVDKVRVMFGGVLFMQSEQTSFSNKPGVVDLFSAASPLRVTSHACTSLDIYLAWILEVQLKTSLFFRTLDRVIYRVALLTLGITQRVIIDPHVDKHFPLTATLSRTHQAAFPLTTVCRTQ